MKIMEPGKHVLFLSFMQMIRIILIVNNGDSDGQLWRCKDSLSLFFISLSRLVTPALNIRVFWNPDMSPWRY